jgi:hypothetical protein
LGCSVNFAGLSFLRPSTNGCYHTTFDDLDVVDWTKLAKQGRIALRTISALGETSTPPTFVPPNPGLASFADAVTLQQVFIRAQPDLPLFSQADQQVIMGVADALDQIVTDGPAMFDQGDVAILLQTALDGIAAIQRPGCRPL